MNEWLSFAPVVEGRKSCVAGGASSEAAECSCRPGRTQSQSVEVVAVDDERATAAARPGCPRYAMQPEGARNLRVSRRVPTLSRVPSVAAHLNRDLLCPCRRGPMPRGCGVAALAAVCEIKPGSRSGSTQVQREWTRAGVVDHGLWTYTPAAGRNFSESVRICPSEKSCGICRYSEPFIQIALGVGSVPVHGRTGMLKRGPREFRMRCVLSRRNRSDAYLRRSAGAGTGVLIRRDRK